MELKQLQEQIRATDIEMSRLLAQRMELSARLAQTRAAQGLVPLDLAGQREAKALFQDQAGDARPDTPACCTPPSRTWPKATRPRP